MQHHYVTEDSNQYNYTIERHNNIRNPSGAESNHLSVAYLNMFSLLINMFYNCFSGIILSRVTMFHALSGLTNWIITFKAENDIRMSSLCLNYL